MTLTNSEEFLLRRVEERFAILERELEEAEEQNRAQTMAIGNQRRELVRLRNKVLGLERELRTTGTERDNFRDWYHELRGVEEVEL